MKPVVLTLMFFVLFFSGVAGGCLVDDFEGYTVVQWHIYNNARYTFADEAVSGEKSIMFSFADCTNDRVETPYYAVSPGFRVSFYFKPVNAFNYHGPLLINIELLSATVVVKWWWTHSARRLANGSYLHTYNYYVRITVSNHDDTVNTTIKYESRQEIPDGLYFRKYRATKWIHVEITHNYNNLTVRVANKTLSLMVPHSPPAVKLSIIAGCHYQRAVLLDRLEINGIRTSTGQGRNMVVAAAAGFLAGLIPALLLGAGGKRRR